MTGETMELQKESFWKEHQDTLVRLRQDLVSSKARRPKFSPVENVRKMSPGVAAHGRKSKHPPYGKYRRTPSPYLPKLSPPADQGQNGRGLRKSDVVPPVKPRLAFIKPAEDYDSWGEQTDDEDEDYVDESHDKADDKSKHKKSPGRTNKPKTQHRRYKPQQYPHTPAPVVYGVPFPVYYPPPPTSTRNILKHATKKTDRNHLHRGRQTRQVAASQGGTFMPKKKRKKNKKNLFPDPSVPVYTSIPMMPAAAVMYPPTLEEDEEEDEEDEAAKSALLYWKQHPLFASDFTDWIIQDYLHMELVPDFLIETFNEIKHMPYDHPLYVPSLYCCEDILADHVSEMVMDVVREAVSDMADDYMDEKMLLRDPLEDFLTTLMEDVVISGVREIVRSTIVELAEDYVTTQYTTGIVHSLVDDLMVEIGPELLDDVTFDLIAEEFISSEVIAPEVREEAVVVARETVQHYDNRIMRREFKEIRQLAENKLADAVMMEFVLSVISQQGQLWTEEDHFSRYLDGVIFNESLSQMFTIKKQRDKTLYCKPLHKLHEKAVSDVALDVFLQQLTRSLDEDLADVDEYERGVTDETVYHFPLIRR